MLFNLKSVLCVLLFAAFCFSASAQRHKKASPDTNKDKKEAKPNGGGSNNGGNSGGTDNNGGNSGGSTDNNGGNAGNGGEINGGNGGNGEKVDPRDCKMNRIDMDATRSLLGRIMFETEKLETAQAQLKDKCATAAQIVEIMGMFMGEMSKGDFAKFAYNYCSDPQNYAQVENALMSEITKSELRAMYNKANDNNGGNNNGGNNNGGNNGNISKDCKMNSIDMSATKPLVERIQFESEKLEAAKAQLKGKCASCSQIAEIMNLFKMDGMKLDFAEFAREYCGDPQNYIIIENVFRSEGFKMMIREQYGK